MNPATDVLEKRVAALEGGVASLAFSSGMAAISAALLTLCAQGDEIVATTRLYGGTVTLLSNTLAQMGIGTTWVDSVAVYHGDMLEGMGFYRDRAFWSSLRAMPSPDPQKSPCRRLSQTCNCGTIGSQRKSQKPIDSGLVKRTGKTNVRRGQTRRR